MQDVHKYIVETFLPSLSRSRVNEVASIYLMRLEGCRFKKIAERLNISEAAAKQRYSRFLVMVKDHINKNESERMKTAVIVSTDRVLTEEQTIAYLDPAEIMRKDGTLIPVKDLPEEVRRAISGIDVIETKDRKGNVIETKYKYRFWDKGKSLERLSRHLGLYNDRIIIQYDEGLRALLEILPPEWREKLEKKLAERQVAKRA